MIIFVAAIALTIIVVVVTKGSFGRLGSLHVRMLWLLFLGLAIQIALEAIDFPKDRIETLGFAMLLLSYVAILGFCVANRNVKGMLIITVGVALNVLVIALNQGMPTKDDVHDRNGREVHVPIEQTVKHRPQDDDTVLSFLGDVISAPGFPNQQFSIGDIVIALGMLDLCFEGSRVPRRRDRRAPRKLSRADRRAGLAGRARPRVPTARGCRRDTQAPNTVLRVRDRPVRGARPTVRRTRSQPSGSVPP